MNKIGNPIYGKIVKEKKKKYFQKIIDDVNEAVDPSVERHGYAFTLNNYTDADYEALKTVKCRWIIFGKEVAPTTGTPHLQGEVYFNEALNLWNALDMFPITMSYVKPWYKGDRRGTGAGVTYCGKNATDVFEQGRRLEQGVDVNIRSIIEETKSMREVFAMTQDPRRISVAKAMLPYIRPEQRHMTVFWYWGPGASTKAKTEAISNGPVYYAPAKNTYWEGYDGEENVLMINYRKTFSSLAVMLNILGGEPMNVNLKFMSRPLSATRIWITTNANPRVTWLSEGSPDVEILESLIHYRGYVCHKNTCDGEKNCSGDCLE